MLQVYRGRNKSSFFGQTLLGHSTDFVELHGEFDWSFQQFDRKMSDDQLLFLALGVLTGLVCVAEGVIISCDKDQQKFTI